MPTLCSFHSSETSPNTGGLLKKRKYTTVIRIINAAIDILSLADGEESIVVRGVIDPTHLKEIKADTYQREVLSASKIEMLKKALRVGRVPDIDLGMRGDNAQEVEDGIFVLQDDVYVIDGLQRKSAGEQLVDEGFMPHIGAVVHLNTNEAWERSRFEALNVGQTGLNTNIILRNLAKSIPAANLMLEITTKQPKFVLNNKVSWGQNMRRGDLITAITFYKTVGRLHSHLGPGKSDPRSLARTGMTKIINETGKGNFANNVTCFFWLIDECFGIQNVVYRNMATHLKASFLQALAGVLSDHEDFWDGSRLVIPADLRRKLSSFPVNDPGVKALASSAGMAARTLEDLMAKHINSGKRTKHLKRRATADIELDEVDEVSEESNIA